MLHFPVLRTKRLTAQLKELSIGDALAVASMPPDRDEATCTAFLRFTLASVTGISDPAHWTVQERILAICHYLAVVSEDGPDFSVGENGHYSDYLDAAKDCPPDVIELDTIDEDRWYIRHLTGAMAETVERLYGEIEGLHGRTHWLVGTMAAQLLRNDEAITNSPTDAADPDYDSLLITRMRYLMGLPESQFSRLLLRFMTGRELLSHLFSIDVTDDGIVAMPKGGVTEKALSPARFPASTCIGAVACELAGKP